MLVFCLFFILNFPLTLLARLGYILLEKIHRIRFTISGSAFKFSAAIPAGTSLIQIHTNLPGRNRHKPLYLLFIGNIRFLQVRLPNDQLHQYTTLPTHPLQLSLLFCANALATLDFLAFAIDMVLGESPRKFRYSACC